MSKNINQIFIANPAAGMLATDLLYLGRSPFGATDDFAITWANMQASITATGTIASGVWNGTVIGLAYGGTNKNITAANGAIVYSDADSFELLAPVAAAGKMLQSGNNAAPTWSIPTYPSASGSAGVILRSDGANNVYTTATYPATTIINQLLYSSSANVISGVTVVNSAVLATSAAGVPTWLGSLANGQIIIGSTGAIPVVANLTAGPGVSISNGVGTITISGTGSGIGWTEVTGATQAMAADQGYVANRGSLITFTLPATAAFGTSISVVGKGAGGWQINQNAGQNIQVGSVSSTVGAGGSIASTNAFDSIDLLCTTANTTWTVEGAPQTSGVTIV